MKVEVHTNPLWWLSIDWQKENLFPLEIVEPTFNPDTDVFLFHEAAVIQPSLYLKVPIEKRFGLLLETAIIQPYQFKSIPHVDKFRVIFTHDPFLLSLNLNYRKNLFGTSWAFRDEDLAGAPKKSRIMSIITSDRSYLTGHRLRRSICKKLYNKNDASVDIFGRNIPWGSYIADRRDGLAPFFFNIAIENCKRDNYFSEKIIDCFVTRTVPIYWGCPNISDFFNIDGMIIINSEREYWIQHERILSDPKGIYNSHKQAMEENFRIAVEKYNVRRGFGSVADQIIQEMKNECSPQILSLADRVYLRLLSKTLITMRACAKACWDIRYWTVPL